VIGQPTPFPPGSTVRFRVHDDTLGSGSSWSVRTSANAADVYVTHRDGGRWVHHSFHESGEWHHTVTEAGRAKQPAMPGYFGTTHDRPEVAPGWTRCLVITVAHSELRAGLVEAAKSRAVVDVPIMSDRDATDVVVMLGSPQAAPIQINNAFLVAELQRGDGGLVIVYATPTDLSVPIADGLAGPIAEARRGLRETGWPNDVDTRIVITGPGDGGHHQMFEIAIDADQTPQGARDSGKKGA
jgi:hypothetical protein